MTDTNTNTNAADDSREPLDDARAALDEFVHAANRKQAFV